MPEATDEVISTLEKRIKEFPAISQLVQGGYRPEQILYELFGRDQVNILEEMPVQFRCKCSKERVERAIIGLGNEEIQKMIEEEDRKSVVKGKRVRIVW